MPSTEFKKRVRPFPFLVLALSLLFTGLATYYLAKTNRTKNFARFTNATLQIENTIRDSLNTYTALLRGGAGLFTASETVTQEEFHTYFNRLRTKHFDRGLSGFGYAKLVRAEEKEALVTEMRRQGHTNFTIWPEGGRDIYVPIIYIVPMEWRNQRAVGYDMFSEPTRNAAMLQAAKQGVAISRKVTLVQETEENRQAGFLMYAGIYSANEFPRTQAEREQKLAGFVYSPFRADDFFEGIFQDERKLPTSLEVFDGEHAVAENLLHSSQNYFSAKPHFTITNQFVIADHTWTLVHRTTPEFEETLEGTNVFWVFITGLGVSAILFGVTFFLAKARQRAEGSERELLHERERLRASEEMYRTIAETAADAIITIDEESKIITVNRAAERIFGYKPEEMTGQSLTILMPERMRGGHRAGISRYLTTGEKKTTWAGIELPGAHKDGREIPLEISFGEIRKNGRIFTGIIRDITERKKAEEQIVRLNRDLEKRVTERTIELQEANAQMEAFVYSIAHDLRAPLRAMRGFAQALREDYDKSLDDAGKDYAARIISSAKFMDDLINDLLTFSRITRAELNLTSVSLDAILAEVREQLATEIQEKNAEIHVTAPLPDVIAHEATTRQILTNLISNALKFVATDITPRIALRAEDSGTHWRIWVEDNGIGIAENYRDRIFGIFERLHGGTYPGTGIGLAIVRKGVERMNGRVGFQSELGQGSRFWFELRKAG